MGVRLIRSPITLRLSSRRAVILPVRARCLASGAGARLRRRVLGFRFRTGAQLSVRPSIL